MTLNQIPNLITLLRLLLLAPFVLSLLDGRYATALVVFAVAGLSDALDGYLARRHGWTTPLGARLDPVADKLLMATSYFMLGWLGWIPLWIVVLVIGRDLIIIGGALVYSRLVKQPDLAPTRISKFNTAAQIIFILSVLTVLSDVALPQWWFMVWLVVVVVTTLWSGTDYVWRWSSSAIMELKEKG